MLIKHRRRRSHNFKKDTLSKAQSRNFKELPTIMGRTAEEDDAAAKAIATSSRLRHAPPSDLQDDTASPAAAAGSTATTSAQRRDETERSKGGLAQAEASYLDPEDMVQSKVSAVSSGRRNRRNQVRFLRIRCCDIQNETRRSPFNTLPFISYTYCSRVTPRVPMLKTKTQRAFILIGNQALSPSEELERAKKMHRRNIPPPSQRLRVTLG